MAIRADTIVGPAKYTMGTDTWYSTNDVNVMIDTTEIDTVWNGERLDSNLVDAVVNFSMKPDGHLTSDLISRFWPYRSTLPGTAVGAGDVACYIDDVNSHRHTVYNAVVSRMPDLHFGVEDTIVQDLGITGIRLTTATDWSANNLYLPATTGGTFADTSFTRPIKQEYIGAWGAIAGFTSFRSAIGFRVRVNTQINWHQMPTVGTFLGTFTGASVAVEFEPVGPTAVQAFTAMAISAAGKKRGASLSSISSSDLTITGEETATYIFTLPDAQLVSGSYRFGTGTNFLRNGQFAFVASRTVTTGTPSALFTLAIA